MKRMIALFTIPRSGSTPISEILAYYFHEAYGYYHLPEYLSLNQKGVVWNNGIIEIQPNSWIPARDYFKGLSLEKFQFEQNRRISYLKKSRASYFLKVFPFQAGNHRRWLLENSKVFFLYRLNLFENLLSYLISDMTNMFYQPDGINIEDGTLTADYESFIRFLRLVSEFRNLRRKYSHCQTLCFEKDFTQSPGALMASLGFNKSIDWGRLRLSKKQNTKNKLLAFSNAEEIASWYQGSILQKYYPIDSISALRNLH